MHLVRTMRRGTGPRDSEAHRPGTPPAGIPRGTASSPSPVHGSWCPLPCMGLPDRVARSEGHLRDSPCTGPLAQLLSEASAGGSAQHNSPHPGRHLEIQPVFDVCEIVAADFADAPQPVAQCAAVDREGCGGLVASPRSPSTRWPPEARPPARRASRTTSASRRASPGASSSNARCSKPTSSVPASWCRPRSRGSARRTTSTSSPSPTGPGRGRAPWCSPRACGTAGSKCPASTVWKASASTTRRRSTRPVSAGRIRSPWSAVGTPPGRRRCSSPTTRPRFTSSSGVAISTRTCRATWWTRWSGTPGSRCCKQRKP
ncbi:hypothetical protein SRIMHP_03620 [Streptomyces rimosus subsp. rimosus]|uniref:Uncharacterized protein n=1 Tax=Streptomyces rimosus subsp. rimosus TaxID=132474 RepID=A0ABY3ZF68_STRRM|nr:hypothetical protein SRIMR7_38755 [Streptomyces rimosus subsp. rimosus]UTH93202.1 hypothetical protein SRIMHP_03620 [Streptomyces rimosus subsp. rimosus]UTJ11297.1 hypothetical protein SRIMDV3_03515 [Streptomyces rimosus subsp. rimosus]